MPVEMTPRPLHHAGRAPPVERRLRLRLPTAAMGRQGQLQRARTGRLLSLAPAAALAALVCRAGVAAPPVAGVATDHVSATAIAAARIQERADGGSGRFGFAGFTASLHKQVSQSFAFDATAGGAVGSVGRFALVRVLGTGQWTYGAITAGFLGGLSVGDALAYPAIQLAAGPRAVRVFARWLAGSAAADPGDRWAVGLAAQQLPGLPQGALSIGLGQSVVGHHMEVSMFNWFSRVGAGVLLRVPRGPWSQPAAAAAPWFASTELGVTLSLPTQLPWPNWPTAATASTVRAASGPQNAPRASDQHGDVAAAQAPGSRTAGRRILVVAPRTVAPPGWPNPRTLLVAGRSWTAVHSVLRADALLHAELPEMVTCTVDETRAIETTVWAHVQCTAELGTRAPPFWRTGCYLLDEHGIWRWPRCPGEDTATAATPELMVPAALPEHGGRFLQMGVVPLQRRALRMGDRDVMATCTLRELEGVSEQCYTEEHGLVWSAWRWRYGPDRTPERAVRTLGAGFGGVVDASAPHLAFVRPEAARCETSAGCLAFGFCKATADGCVAGNDGDCERSAACRRAGQCGAVGSGCAPRTLMDCQDSLGCANASRCSLAGDRCVASMSDCANSEGCRREGLCTSALGGCAARSDADCRQAQVCHTAGKCRRVGDRCQSPEP
ncbi:MAG: hypothetical protein FJ100_15425 [Deltaproteobacteria bacterium]|nr:hypothetical protein [Deltaproteobacteria bacterium]